MNFVYCNATQQFCGAKLHQNGWIIIDVASGGAKDLLNLAPTKFWAGSTTLIVSIKKLFHE